METSNENLHKDAETLYIINTNLGICILKMLYHEVRSCVIKVSA